MGKLHENRSMMTYDNYKLATPDSKDIITCPKCDNTLDNIDDICRVCEIAQELKDGAKYERFNNIYIKARSKKEAIEKSTWSFYTGFGGWYIRKRDIETQNAIMNICERRL